MRARRAVTFLAATVVVVALVSSPSPAQVIPTNPLDGIRGVRWKPGTAKRDVLVTRAPYAGITDSESEAADRTTAQRRVARMLSAQGINAATIDVTPYKKVWKSLQEQKPPLDNRQDNPCYDPQHKDKRPSSACDGAIDQWKSLQYTAIADFITDVVTDPDDQGVGSNFKFFLHSRVNGRDLFVQDMVAAIQHVEAAGHGSRLAGVMIGEHERRVPYNDAEGGYLPLAVYIADAINGATDDWLLNDRVLTINGGHFGADFNGIGPAITEYDFFTKIAAETDFLGFTFKYFLGDKPTRNYNTPDDKGDAAWERFLKEPDGPGPKVKSLNLDGLEAQLSTAPDQFREVLFVGDSADGLYGVKTDEVVRDGRLLQSWDRVGCRTVRAIRRVFTEHGWESFLFGQPLDHRDQITDQFKRGMWSHAFKPQRPLTWWEEWTDPTSGDNNRHFLPCS